MQNVSRSSRIGAAFVGAWALVFAAAAMSSCGARSSVEELAGSTAVEDAGDLGEEASPAPDDGGLDDAHADADLDAREDATVDAPAPQCLCPDEPGYTPCVLPLMCCPCAPSCENPDTFNCTCEDPASCTRTN